MAVSQCHSFSRIYADPLSGYIKDKEGPRFPRPKLGICYFVCFVEGCRHGWHRRLFVLVYYSDKQPIHVSIPNHIVDVRPQEDLSEVLLSAQLVSSSRALAIRYRYLP